MVIVLLRIRIEPPQKTAPHTARDEVESAGLARRHEIASGGGHAGMITTWRGDSDQITLGLESENSYLVR